MTSKSVIKISSTKSYPAFQLRFEAKHSSLNSHNTLIYLLMVVEKWIFQRTGLNLDLNMTTDNDVDMVTLLNDNLIVSHHIDNGYEIDITSLIADNKWAACFREPDRDTEDRAAVTGRFFATDIALSSLDDEWVECAVRITVMEPVDCEEVPFAFRPQFIRSIFKEPNVEVRQLSTLNASEAIYINDAEQLSLFKRVMYSEQNDLPAVIFTHATQNINVKDVFDAIDASIGRVKAEKTLHQIVIENLVCPEYIQLESQSQPYDFDIFAGYTFGYSRTYVIPPNMMNAFQGMFSQTIDAGDVIWLEPVKFGGFIEIFRLSEYAKNRQREKLVKTLLDRAHEYSKRKFIVYDGIAFEDELHGNEDWEKLEELKKKITSDVEKEVLDQAIEMVDKAKEAQRQAEQQRDDLAKKLYNANAQNAFLQETNKSIKATDPIGLKRSETKELYKGEQHDLVVSILRQSIGMFYPENSHANDLLQSIIDQNITYDVGKELFQELENIVCGERNFSESTISKLQALGFNVTRLENGHYRIGFSECDKYSGVFAGTASDWRSRKNSCKDLIRLLSVYKN